MGAGWGILMGVGTQSLHSKFLAAYQRIAPVDVGHDAAIRNKRIGIKCVCRVAVSSAKVKPTLAVVR